MNVKSKIFLGIAEDHVIVREGIVALLERNEAIKVLFQASNGREVMDKLGQYKPDIMLLDIGMPELSGVETLERIIKEYPSIKVILLSSYFIKPYVIKYIQMGARAYLPKDCGIVKLFSAIQQVHEKGYYYDQEVEMMLAEVTPDHVPVKENISPDFNFSEMELKILQKVCEGKASKSIAAELDLSTRTVEWYRSKILKKANCTSTQLIRFAIKHNLYKE